MKHLFPIVSLCGAIVLAGCGSSSSSSSGSDDPSGGTPTNVAPTIAGDANTTVSVGQPYSFTPTAGDADGDALTFSIENKPAWADFNASNGALTGTPTAYGATADINISVSDGEASASLPLFTITVYERVKATGQMKSYDETGTEVTDGSLKDDGYYRAGTALDYERDDTLEIVTDNVTGMIWQDDATVETSVSLINEETWSEVYPVATACDRTNTLAVGGYSDWRVPTIAEQLTFLDMGTGDSFVKVVEHTFTYSLTQSILNSSSDTDMNRKVWAFTHGSSAYIKNADSTYNKVQCVRGNALDTTTTLARDNETAIVTDTKTGLMWQDDANITDSGTMDWAAAIDHCEAMTLGGYDDWRLPNFMEMVSITDFDAETIKTGFENAGGTEYFWTSTSNGGVPSKAWYYRFNPDSTYFANAYAYMKTQGSFKAMCVRTIE